MEVPPFQETSIFFIQPHHNPSSICRCPEISIPQTHHNPNTWMSLGYPPWRNGNPHILPSSWSCSYDQTSFINSALTISIQTPSMAQSYPQSLTNCIRPSILMVYSGNSLSYQNGWLGVPQTIAFPITTQNSEVLFSLVAPYFMTRKPEKKNMNLYTLFISHWYPNTDFSPSTWHLPPTFAPHHFSPSLH